jgi:hypothetical protein
MPRKPRKRRKPATPARAHPRATTVERAERALERTSQNVDTHTDDPARDKSDMSGGVIKPLKHAD